MMKKKLFIALMFVMVVMPVLAVSVCTKDSLVTIVLDPSIGGSGYTYNRQMSTWKTTFTYGTVSGISTCLDTAPGGGGGMGTARSDITANGGEVLGGYCYCKMTHPMASLWVFNVGGSESYCLSDCATLCGNHVRMYTVLRSGLFGSVAP